MIKRTAILAIALSAGVALAHDGSTPRGYGGGSTSHQSRQVPHWGGRVTQPEPYIMQEPNVDELPGDIRNREFYRHYHEFDEEGDR
jgi:hypothetical protein